ncbi:PQ-loop-domain-containing protein [Lizonia empirigonia]|nr:PQ-loop-domain-containing protein [Lizonia empirigonia]
MDRPSLPAHCEPADEFLQAVSIAFHTCIPSYLALTSTVLGTCSIVSWLFAQLPQIYKNHKLKSTSGLSVYFLTEWLLGDVTNLLGCLFTGQATWQIVIAGYYVLVDCGLTGQWVWYELLHHGRPLRPIWGRWRSGENHSGSGNGGMEQVSKGKTPDTPDAKSDKKDIQVQHSAPLDAFRIPNFARSPSGVKESYAVSPLGMPGAPSTPGTPGTPSTRYIRRAGGSSSPLPSAQTMLYISIIFAVLSSGTLAHPTGPQSPRTLSTTPQSTRDLLGKIFSWSSTLLYLGSRLPQLYKNQIRRSTAGLSPSLFVAAFFGNLFYSTSLLTNPCAWRDFAPHSGWSEAGSTRAEWVLRALPFFLGAAGVLIMDAAVGMQFLILITVDDHGVPRRKRLHWRRVSGWMRGWAPAVSVAASPSVSRASTPALTPRDRSPAPWDQGSDTSGSSSRSQSIPIRGALDEARALLGTSRHASPRSYGALSSPR